ncbi:MAG: sterol desaturase family protein [Candidatus Geothermincolia bacterium]
MNAFLIDHETGLRLAFFLGVFSLIAAWELLAPRRALSTPKGRRWARNIGLTALNSAAVRLLVPLQAVGVAAQVEQQGWGLAGLSGRAPVLSIVATVAILDLAIYAQHWSFHRNPYFWRLHMVHHVDLDIDVTTGARFHPVEILLSMAIKMILVLLIGAPVAGVVAFEILLNATSLFSHGNVRIADGIDRVLRRVVVTPDMHRVHHSVLPEETFSNFGFNLSWWDRMFGTYRPQPREGHAGMSIGLPRFRDPEQVGLPWLMLLPFKKRKGDPTTSFP